MLILDTNFRRHLEAFAFELLMYSRLQYLHLFYVLIICI